MDGFQKPDAGKKSVAFYPSANKGFIYPELLKNMIDHTIFSKFHFVTRSDCFPSAGLPL